MSRLYLLSNTLTSNNNPSHASYLSIQFKRRFIVITGLYLLLSLIAAIIYSTTEGINFLKAFYLGLTTAIGTEVIQTVNPITKMIGLIIMIGEWVCLWVGFENSVNFLSEGRLREYLEGGHIKKIIEKMNQHIIICGGGRVGHEIATQLEKTKQVCVIIEKDELKSKDLTNEGHLVLNGDTLKEKVLLTAGIKKAKLLIAAYGDDADNVFLTLTAKELNPNIKIIARVENESNIKKMEQAGVSRVILPSIIGARAMADAACDEIDIECIPEINEET